jgi:aspartyl/asparaginyl beta-hydroxylase (cupin superfamily)
MKLNINCFRLRAMPWWDTNEFPWIEKVRENFSVIRDEIVALRNEKGF